MVENQSDQNERTYPPLAQVSYRLLIQHNYYYRPFPQPKEDIAIMYSKAVYMHVQKINFLVMWSAM